MCTVSYYKLLQSFIIFIHLLLGQRIVLYGEVGQEGLKPQCLQFSEMRISIKKPRLLLEFNVFTCLNILNQW